MFAEMNPQRRSLLGCLETVEGSLSSRALSRPVDHVPLKVKKNNLKAIFMIYLDPVE
jgi:hypothetical protein